MTRPFQEGDFEFPCDEKGYHVPLPSPVFVLKGNKKPH